jgi:hypothetical protein
MTNPKSHDTIKGSASRKNSRFLAALGMTIPERVAAAIIRIPFS